MRVSERPGELRKRLVSGSPQIPAQLTKQTMQGTRISPWKSRSLVGVSSIAVTPVALLLNIAQTRQLTAFVFDASGNRLTDRTVTWSSDSPEVATVSSTGLISSIGSGYATITATCEGKTFSLAVTVTDDY